MPLGPMPLGAMLPEVGVLPGWPGVPGVCAPGVPGADCGPDVGVLLLVAEAETVAGAEGGTEAEVGAPA